MTRLILELTRPYRWIIAIVLAAMLVQTVMSLAAPWPLKIILDNVVVVKHPLPHWMTALLPAPGGKNKIYIVEPGSTWLKRREMRWCSGPITRRPRWPWGS